MKTFSMMILGPRQPRNDIDVYLIPLVEDLTKLWGEGVVVFDWYRNKTFMLCAIETQATYNWNMEEKYTLDISIFSNLITLIAKWKNLLMEVKNMKVRWYH